MRARRSAGPAEWRRLRFSDTGTRSVMAYPSVIFSMARRRLPNKTEHTFPWGWCRSILRFSTASEDLRHPSSLCSAGSDPSSTRANPAAGSNRCTYVKGAEDTMQTSDTNKHVTAPGSRREMTSCLGLWQAGSVLYWWEGQLRPAFFSGPELHGEWLDGYISGKTV